MIPRTHHNLGLFEVLSAMQKAVRRADEEMAMEMACELVHTSKAYCTAACNRLEVISHEDVGQPEAILFTATCVEQAKRRYNPEKPGEARLMIGTAIRFLCRSVKTRANTHFAAAIGLENLNGKVPVIPDHAYDVHTSKGRKMGRNLAHFRAECAKLVKQVDEPDPYESRAYAQWEKKYASTAEPDQPELVNGSDHI